MTAAIQGLNLNRRHLIRFALLGAISGAFAVALLYVLPAPDHDEIELFGWLKLSSISLVPGLSFGAIFGLVLHLRGVASGTSSVGYAVASTVSYLAAYTFAVEWGSGFMALWQIGMAAGLIGSACLSTFAAWMFPCARRRGPFVLMLVAGCLLGLLLEFPIQDGGTIWHWAILFVPWQAGYAAAFATALPGRA